MNKNPNDSEPMPTTRVSKRGATKRTAILAGSAFGVVALMVWLVLVNRRDTNNIQAAEKSADMRGLANMDGMAGMNMSTDGSVHLTANQLRQFGITFGTADVRALEDRIRTTGIVTINETRIAQVAPKFGGFVERLYVDFTGQPVRRGQPLLQIYSPELVAAQEELLIARQLDTTINESVIPGVPKSASNLLAAATRRLRLWDISDTQIQSILRTGVVQRSLTLHAPASGVVIEKNVVQGQAIQPGQSLYTIADLTDVWVEVELRESEAGSVREGSRAALEFAAFPGRVLDGRVAYVYPTLQEASRTIKARVAVANTDGRIKPGMFATVRFTSSGIRALSVPAAAVIRTGERSVVFVDMGGGRLLPQEIETGRVGADFVEVLAGLEPGQRVVTSAQFLLESESNIGEVMKAMIGMGGDMDGMEGMDMPSMDMKGAKMPPQEKRP